MLTTLHFAILCVYLQSVSVCSDVYNCYVTFYICCGVSTKPSLHPNRLNTSLIICIHDMKGPGKRHLK
ncbi:hypothetical protein XELAEV_18015660mg [Xenopus laevis]|uniref:Secreted protein n=1 Tax=Xenopus laevis TaxID=8355 RepID=A0A974DIE3_XENLA|nr:hypothetical protein XELAEV_18015660mg [Xenopus laevis]